MDEATAGMWATMLTPFTTSGEVDHAALDHLVEWYIENRVVGDAR